VVCTGVEIPMGSPETSPMFAHFYSGNVCLRYVRMNFHSFIDFEMTGAVFKIHICC
jgi:hypothetical protein